VASDRKGNDLVQCVYVSAAAPNFGEDALTSILEKSREKNLIAGITGMLVFAEGSFLQILEGPSDAVAAIFSRIEQDRRHNRVMRLLHGPIEQRAFGDWTMGLCKSTHADLRTLPGCNDLFTGDTCLREVSAGQARTILEGFRRDMGRYAA